MTLSARGVSVEVGHCRLVDEVSVDVVPGQVLVVVGGNGAGKSTLLRTLAGELRPTRGVVTMGDVDLVRWSRVALSRSRAVLNQRSTVSCAMNCVDVVLLGRLPHGGGIEIPVDRAIARASLRRMGVDQLAERPYASLSGGEQQRVQLARTLAQIFDAVNGRERYLLLDEPTSALDLAHQHLCLRVARRAASRGVGVVAVLHDLVLAGQYADRIAVLCGGRLVASGESATVLTPALIASVFGVSSRVRLHRRTGRPQLTLGTLISRPKRTRHRDASQSEVRIA